MSKRSVLCFSCHRFYDSRGPDETDVPDGCPYCLAKPTKWHSKTDLLFNNHVEEAPPGENGKECPLCMGGGEMLCDSLGFCLHYEKCMDGGGPEECPPCAQCDGTGKVDEKTY